MDQSELTSLTKQTTLLKKKVRHQRCNSSLYALFFQPLFGHLQKPTLDLGLSQEQRNGKPSRAALKLSVVPTAFMILR